VITKAILATSVLRLLYRELEIAFRVFEFLEFGCVGRKFETVFLGCESAEFGLSSQVCETEIPEREFLFPGPL
jgi:hypothetical protein